MHSLKSKILFMEPSLLDVDLQIWLMLTFFLCPTESLSAVVASPPVKTFFARLFCIFTRKGSST